MGVSHERSTPARLWTKGLKPHRKVGSFRNTEFLRGAVRHERVVPWVLDEDALYTRAILELVSPALALEIWVKEAFVRLPEKKKFKLPWREAGPPNHHDDNVDSDQ